jgi:hypothetical protein
VSLARKENGGAVGGPFKGLYRAQVFDFNRGHELLRSARATVTKPPKTFAASLSLENQLCDQEAKFA